MTQMVTEKIGTARDPVVLTLIPMTEQQRGRRAIEVGPTGKTVAANLVRLRDRRGLTTRQLSTQLEQAGRPIPASGITRMEKGERVVSADELVALAVALGVSPAALLLPLNDRPDTRYEVTGAGTVGAADGWDWIEGKGPLRTEGHRPPGTESRDDQAEHLEYLLNSVPAERRRLRTHPLGRALEAVREDVEAMHMRLRFHLFNHPEKAERLTERAQQAVARLGDEINRLGQQLAEGADQQEEGGDG